VAGRTGRGAGGGWQDDRVTAPDLRFALDLQAALAGADPTAGFVWSPYSVASALGLAAAGARGRTREEIAAALTGAGAGELAGLAAGLAQAARLDEFEGGPEARIAVANTLWADATLPVAPDYAAAVRAWPGGAVRGADFCGAPDAARREVNADVERSTNGLIRDLLGPGLVRPDTRAILVNALWLRASWLQEFPRSATRPAPFRAPGGSVEVPTMQVEGKLRYAAGAGWQLVGLPAGGGVRAEVLLPDGDLADAEPALTAGGMAGLLAAATPTRVALWLPKFRVEGEAELVEPLAGLGVRSLFTDAADLSGVTGGEEPLKVSQAVHKAVLTVDEGGLEGAAATALSMVRVAAMLAPPRALQVRVDRPFLVLVRHQDSGAIYFLARVTRP
jgi:serine protease inhibitor